MAVSGRRARLRDPGQFEHASGSCCPVLYVLLFALTHPRWEFVFGPKYAAYLNLIEPWWKVLRSLALAGRRFESWDEMWQAIEAATA